MSLRIPPFGKLLGVVVMLSVLTLAGCGGGGSGNATATATSKPGAGVNVTIGSKNDPDGQLLAEMYSLLLQQQGYNVTTKLALGQTNVLDADIKAGSIDIYPEFTGTALALLKLPTNVQDPQTAYNQVKTAYEQQFHITWLDAAFGLNDSYGICTNQANASTYHLASLSDLAPVANQLTIAQQADAPQILVPVEQAYGINFKGSVQIDESLSFAAVNQNKAQVNECYTTDPSIVIDNFVLLKDPKNAFPLYNPSPLVRDQLLTKSPAISGILNPLASKLTTASQTALIKQVAVDHTPIQQVAQTWLQQQGLLPKS
jgi:osmoprotectant transport system substrate-binding protein